MYQEKCLSTKLIKQSDWSMVSSNEHMNHGRVRPELDRTKISKQAYSHCKIITDGFACKKMEHFAEYERTHVLYAISRV